MIINILVAGFVLMMAYYWYTQGLFSAFLHLAAVVTAGALAFALWEPTAHWLLSTETVASYYAWGISLVGWFLVILMAVRLLLDRFVADNVQCQGLANLIGGGLCGLASGLLTAGVVVIGIGFTPMPMSLGGYQPYSISPTNQPQQTGSSLWIQADRVAAGFFTRLSSGAFAPWGTAASLETHRPDPVVQSAMFRFRYDENASIVAAPDAIGVTQRLELRLPSDELPADLAHALGTRTQQPGHQLVVLETVWNQHPAGYDRGTVRIGQSQVQLFTSEDEGGGEAGLSQPYYPVAFAKDDASGAQRQLYPFRDERVVAYNTSNEQTFVFAFVVPADEVPQFALIRQLRFPLQGLSPVNEPDVLLAALGELFVPEEPAEGASSPRSAGQSEGPLEQTNRLPAAFSKNYAPRFEYDGTMIVSGTGEVTQSGGRLTETTRADGIFEPGHQRMVRLRADIRQARSLLGQVRQAAERVHGITLEDQRGQHIDPIAYVWRKSGGAQEIRVDLDSRIRSATQLPQPASMGSDDELYLYFLVSPGVTIQRYHLGPNDSHDVSFEVQ